jgi:putative tricarboxylic transport membrane protein
MAVREPPLLSSKKREDHCKGTIGGVFIMSTLNRRSFVAGTTAGIAAISLMPAVLTTPAFAQEGWGSETLQIMAPAKPGGGWDTTAREIQRSLQEAKLVGTVDVFNVEGAGGTIGLADLASKYKDDGHMMMVMGLVMIGAIGLNEAPVGLDKSTPIARLTGEYEVIVVPSASELKTMDDLVKMFKEDPGSVSWAGGSAGGTDHLLVGFIAQALEIDPTEINYVPFSGGGEALASLLGNETTAGVSGLGEFLPQIESGELRALAVSGRPEGGDKAIPTLKESGVDVELANWRGIVAPPEISADDKTAMLTAIKALHESDVWKATLTKFGWIDLYMEGDEFATYIADETERINTTLVSLGLLEG